MTKIIKGAAENLSKMQYNEEINVHYENNFSILNIRIIYNLI